MTTVKELLDAATPLPWTVSPHPNPGFGVNIESELPDVDGQLAMYVTPPDAALIVYAVNRLPDYEAAVEALGRLVATSERIGGGGTNGEWWLPFQRSIREGRAALARLREQVPA